MRKLKNKKKSAMVGQSKSNPVFGAKENVCIYIGCRALWKWVVEVILPSDKKETPLYSRAGWKGKKKLKTKKGKRKYGRAGVRWGENRKNIRKG